MEAFRNFVSYGIAEWAYACAGGGPSTAFHQYNSINRDTWEKEVSGILSFFSNSKKKIPRWLEDSYRLHQSGRRELILYVVTDTQTASEIPWGATSIFFTSLSSPFLAVLWETEIQKERVGGMGSSFLLPFSFFFELTDKEVRDSWRRNSRRSRKCLAQAETK